VIRRGGTLLSHEGRQLREGHRIHRTLRTRTRSTRRFSRRLSRRRTLVACQQVPLVQVQRGTLGTVPRRGTVLAPVSGERRQQWRLTNERHFLRLASVTHFLMLSQLGLAEKNFCTQVTLEP